MSRLKKKVSKFDKRYYFILAFIVIGLGIMFAVNAASPTAHFEAESGTRTANATVASDASASAGQHLKFNAPAGGGAQNCPPFPAFPDANCTGVPPGTTLTPSGSMTISTAGAVIEARDITGSITVNAPNVTIRKSRIRGNAFMLIRSNSTNLVVEDSELFNLPVSGQNNCHNAIGFGGFTVRRTEIAGCENAADVGEGDVSFIDNYVHDLDTTGPSWVWGMEPHTDGIQGVGNNVRIIHNWIDPSIGGGITAPIIMDVNGSGRDVWIEENYLDGRGASYAIYANRQSSTNIFINRNRMYKGYGYTACIRLGITVTEFNDNRDAGTNVLLTPDNGFDGGCSN